MEPQDVGRPDESRQPCSDSWDRDPDKLIRPRFADSIRAGGHHAAPTGRTHERKRLLLPITFTKPLRAGGHPHMTHYPMPISDLGCDRFSKATFARWISMGETRRFWPLP